MTGQQKQIGNKNYSLSPDVKKIAEDLIKTDEFLQTQNLDMVKIEYIAVYPNISKFVQGRCIRSGRELKFFSNYDYLIEVSGEAWDQLDDETKRILVLHELMHIKIEFNKKGEPIFTIRDHDIKDFYYIVNAYGIGWFSKLRTEVSSIYDLDPKDESKIKL